jgi:hypothetical protein
VFRKLTGTPKGQTCGPCKTGMRAGCWIIDLVGLKCLPNIPISLLSGLFGTELMRCRDLSRRIRTWKNRSPFSAVIINVAVKLTGKLIRSGRTHTLEIPLAGTRKCSCFPPSVVYIHTGARHDSVDDLAGARVRPMFPAEPDGDLRMVRRTKRP